MTTKTATYTFEATVTLHGDVAIETVNLLVRNGSYCIHHCEFPASNLGTDPAANVERYTDGMLHSIVRMAGNQLRQDGIRDNV